MLGLLSLKQLLTCLSTNHSPELFNGNEQLTHPLSLKDTDVPLELSETLRDDNFLHFDSGLDDRDRTLKLETLESNTVWHADGTVKTFLQWLLINLFN